MIDPKGSDDIADDADLEAVRRAFSNWQSVSCSYLSFMEQPWVGTGLVQNDRQNRVFWVEEAQDWPAVPSVLALTYAFYSVGQNPIISDADIILNGANWRWTTDTAVVGTGTPLALDVETVVFHEVGHFFGLDHSTDPTAAMYESNNKAVQRGPAPDDVLGICSLYPNGQPVPGDSVGGASVGSPCTASDQCESRICLQDRLLQRDYCSQICVASQPDACPSGFACEQADDGRSYCLAPAPVDELCDQCSNGEQCASGLCVTVPDVNGLQPFCSRACDPTPGQPQNCPDGYRCVVTQQVAARVGACVPNSGICDPQGRGGQNEPCFANGRCKSGHRCVEYFAGSGPSFCYLECPATSQGQNCGADGVVCTPVADLMSTAVCFTYVTTGQPCVPEVCDARSFCAFDQAAGVDSALCYQRCPNGQSDCPANHQCVTPAGLPALCVPNEGFKNDGEACQSDAECISRTCRPFGRASLCTRLCDVANPVACAAGLRCLAAAGQTTGFCGPETDPARPVVGAPLDYCVCDRTNACDDGCDCDPECDGSSCTCVSVPGARNAAPFGVLLLGLALLAALRRAGKVTRHRG